MNTRVNYLYRDASNYKKYQSVVVSGTLPASDIIHIRGKLSCGEFFIPAQIGLPEERFEDITEDDHCWFELGAFEETDEAPTIDMTAKELAERFFNVQYWDDIKYVA